ncbi:glycosyltransferase family 4 protein, partial [Cellulomonas sp. NPDC057328]|uniref:glycosyltransferase family 4 protein n=1 Tax=Cellulomonas sp. NPDC057328 TaxID=3346101 RepID=UPI00364552A1
MRAQAGTGSTSGAGRALHVAVDATAVPADRGGVGRYLDALIPALAARADVRLTVVVQPRDAEQVRALAPGATVLAAPAAIARRPVRLCWEQVGLPRLVARARADVLLSPHYTMPLLGPVPVVVTLHDATFFSHPHLHSRLKAVFFRTATRLAVRRAAGLVVPSRATLEELVRFAGARRDRVVVALHGVDPEVFHPVPEAERARVRRALGLGDSRYVAFLGTLEPRKNVPALVRAWSSAVEGTDAPPALVLAGGRGWDTGVDPAIAAVPSGLTVLRPGYLPYEDLAGYLAGAEVVAYPSLGEGFGLPVLEAMACGAAVLTSRELSLTEVGGDAVAYAGTDAPDIARHLRALLSDPGHRRALAGAARARARLFTWEASAERHAEAFAA